MSTQNIIYRAHADVADPFKRLVTDEISSAAAIETFNDTAAAYAALPFDDARFEILITPPGWLDHDVPTALLERVRGGRLRVVTWDAVAPVTKKCPATLLPADLKDDVRALVIHHLTRRPAWGLAMIMPAGGRVRSERLRSEAQIAAKIESSLEYINAGAPEWHDRGLSVRLALTALFAVALGRPADRAADQPPTYQIGVGGSTVAVAVRWINKDATLASWVEPAVEWRAVFAKATASFVVINPKSGEIEVTLAFAANDSGRATTPLVLDVLTPERQRLGRALPEEKSIAFELFTAPAEAGAPVAPARVVANPNLEAHGLRVEYHKLGIQFKEMQVTSNEYLRRMAQSIEAEKVARAEVHQLQVQLEYMKEKEAELTRKLQAALDQFATLKLAKKKKKAG